MSFPSPSLALCAVALAAGCAPTRPPPTARPRPPMWAEAGRAAAPERADLDECFAGAQRPDETTLRSLMAAGVNAQLSQLSMIAFHDPRPDDDDERAMELHAAAGRLARC